MNISNYLTIRAALHPNRPAVTFPKSGGYQSLSFLELENLTNQYCYFFKMAGVQSRSKVLLFVRPGLHFSALVFSIFRIGAIPILIDPGMGRKNLFSAIERVKPEILIAEPIVHHLRLFFPKVFKSINVFISTKGPAVCDFFLPNRQIEFKETYQSYDADPDEMAAILFTSGGTGTPKGVVYTHKIYDTQIKLLQTMFSLTDKDIDYPCFPLFSLFTIVMGMTSCIPSLKSLNPSKPAKCNPKKLVQEILDQKPTFLAGSPAIWDKVGRFCQEKKITLPSVKYLVMFGAPVRLEIHEMFKPILFNGTTYTPYGATESLPVTLISGIEVEKNFEKKMREGLGTCVGKPVNSIRVKIKTFDNEKERGEILVSGDVVTKEYYQFPEETKKAKVIDETGFWHKIGDVGYLDENNNLWFLGRTSHVVRTKDINHYPIAVEAIFNNHPEVKRSALIGLSKSNEIRPAIVIERHDHFKDLPKLKRDKFFRELKELGSRHSHTKMIEDFFLYDYFPVDVRHNIKIDRNFLSTWANNLCVS